MVRAWHGVGWPNSPPPPAASSEGGARRLRAQQSPALLNPAISISNALCSPVTDAGASSCIARVATDQVCEERCNYLYLTRHKTTKLHHCQAAL